MHNIDEIMSMLDWNQPDEIQEKGRELAGNVECFHVFLQPCYVKYNKNVWDNCALIIADKSDEELCPFLSQLFTWLEDMNWPGAFCIWDRLKQFQDKEQLIYILDESIYKAKALKRRMWLSNLCEFKGVKDSVEYKHEMFVRRVYDTLVEDSMQREEISNSSIQIFHGMPEQRKNKLELYQSLDENQKKTFLNSIKNAKANAIYETFCMLEGGGSKKDRHLFEVEIKINGMEVDEELSAIFWKVAIEKDLDNMMI